MSISSSQTLVSKTIPQEKEWRTLGEMIASWTGARHIQVEAGVSCSARKQRSTWNQPANEKTYMRVRQRGRGAKGQRWNNLSTKINK